MDIKHRCFKWTLAVFSIAFIFYILTATHSTYPGVSAQFIADMEIGVPHTSQPLATLCYYAIYLHYGHLGVMLLSAFFGALIVAGFSRFGFYTIWLSCMSDNAFNSSPAELKKVTISTTKIAIITGLLLSLFILFATPCWAIGTRPLPSGIAMAIAVWMLAVTAELRWRFLKSFMQEQPKVSIGECIRTVSIFAAGTLLAILSTPYILFVVAIFALIILLLVHPAATFRLKILFFAILGIVFGVALSLVGAYFISNTFGDGSTLTQWVAFLQTLYPQLMQTLTSTTGLMATILFFLCLFIHIYHFPIAFSSFRQSIIGHVVILALLVLSILRWPTDFWQDVAEPSEMVALAYCLSLSCIILFFASLTKCFLDIYYKHTLPRPFLAILISVCFGLCLGVIIESFYQNRIEGPSYHLNDSMADFRKELNTQYKGNAILWYGPNVISELLSKDLIHVKSFKTLRKSQRFATQKTWGDYLNEDPILRKLTTIGEAATLTYLKNTAPYSHYFFDPSQNEQFNAFLLTSLDKLQANAFTSTPVGQHFFEQVRLFTARQYMAQANYLAAYKLEKDNPCILQALAVQKALPKESKRALLAQQERIPALLNPPPATVTLLENRYGICHAPSFNYAHILHALSTDARTLAESEILTATPLADPRAKSINEEFLSLKTLLTPTDEMGDALLAQADPNIDQVTLFICANLKNDKAQQLLTKFATQLPKESGLNLFLRKKQENSQYVINKLSAIYSTHRKLSDALLYLQLMIDAQQFNEATKYVSGSIFIEGFNKTPYLMEHLRLRVLAKLSQEEALRNCRVWLQSNPQQPAIWKALLTNTMLSNEELKQARNECLCYYPLHEEATRLLAEELQATDGQEAALAYRKAIEQARRTLTVRTDYVNI